MVSILIRSLQYIFPVFACSDKHTYAERSVAARLGFARLHELSGFYGCRVGYTFTSLVIYWYYKVLFSSGHYLRSFLRLLNPDSQAELCCMTVSSYSCDVNAFVIDDKFQIVIFSVDYQVTA